MLSFLPILTVQYPHATGLVRCLPVLSTPSHIDLIISRRLTKWTKTQPQQERSGSIVPDIYCCPQGTYSKRIGELFNHGTCSTHANPLAPNVRVDNIGNVSDQVTLDGCLHIAQDLSI